MSLLIDFIILILNIIQRGSLKFFFFCLSANACAKHVDEGSVWSETEKPKKEKKNKEKKVTVSILSKYTSSVIVGEHSAWQSNIQTICMHIFILRFYAGQPDQNEIIMTNVANR